MDANGSGTKLSLTILCPSTAIAETTHLLGMCNDEGVVEFLDSPLPMPRPALATLGAQDLRDRLRLTGPCVRQSCAHWEGHCALGRRLAAASEPATRSCPITATCRWRLENGDSVCGICPSVTWYREEEGLRA